MQQFWEHNGGGLIKTSGGALTLANCTITNNAMRFQEGVGCRFTAGSVLMTNCVVAGNTIPHNGGSYINLGKYGIGLYATGANLEIVDCVISNQSADTADARSTSGGGLSFDNGTCRVVRTTFVSNRGPNNGAGGGAVYLHSGATMSAVFSNCIFRANQVDSTQGSDGYGGAIWANLNAARTAAFVNCTFAFNTNKLGNGGAVYLSNGTLLMRNCVLWTNRVTNTGKLGHDVNVAGGTLRASYSGLTGTASPHVYVTGGSATFSSCMTNNPLFASATDLHVQSTAGRWQNGSYVTSDTAYSPCIDAGDPADSVGAEPAANGARVNIGVYAGTDQASKSPTAAPLVANRSVLTNNTTQMILRGELTNDAAVIATVGICYGTNSVVGETTNGWQYVAQIYPPQQTGTVFSVTTLFLLTNTTYYYRTYAPIRTVAVGRRRNLSQRFRTIRQDGVSVAGRM